MPIAQESGFGAMVSGANGMRGGRDIGLHASVFLGKVSREDRSS